jgi:glycosyltransferase involved in cell wall biosynthesis
MRQILVGIPTRDRPEYLSCLLSSLLFQTEKDFDVLIVDTSTEDEILANHPMISRFVTTLRGVGHGVRFIRVDVAGRSEVTAVNRIILTAYLENYDFVYKIDDDHVLPPIALNQFLSVMRTREKCKEPCLISGVTPWMKKVFDDGSSPSDPLRSTVVSQRGMTYVAEVFEEDVRLQIGHFSRYDSAERVPTELASAANFFFRPDIRILWSDIGRSSKYADAVWFTQLQKLLGYEFFFLSGVPVWHVAAHQGGVRELPEVFCKDFEEDALRANFFAKLLQEFSDEQH